MNSVIAIDGPAASGKSTVAKKVANKLDWLYVDSGAMYRAVTWAALEKSLDTGDSSLLAQFVETINMDFAVNDGAVVFKINDRSLGEELRTEQINQHVSPVAANPHVRKQVVAWLRSMTEFGNLVMEGRDIGTAVFPDTPHKFYLDASPEERARRRHAEISDDEKNSTVETIGKSLSRRDKIDSSRKTDPLKIASGANVVDSTKMSVDQVAEYILNNSA